MVKFYRKTKNPVSKQKYKTMRNYKDFEKERFEQICVTHPSYLLAQTETDANLATCHLQISINDSLDICAPIKRYK